MKLSIFKNFNKVVANSDLTTISEIIRNGRYKAQVEDLQKILSEGKQKEYTEAKKQLPALHHQQVL